MARPKKLGVGGVDILLGEVGRGVLTYPFNFFYPSYGLDQNPIFLLFLHLGEGGEIIFCSVCPRETCLCMYYKYRYIIYCDTFCRNYRR